MNQLKTISIVLFTFVLSACGDFWYTDVEPKNVPSTANPATGNPNTPEDNDPIVPAVKTWHHPINLADNISVNGTNAILPKVAMDQNNNAIAVWEQSDGVRTQIFKSEYRNGVWSHPTSLSDNISPDSQFAFWPEVAMDNNGNAIIVWRQGDDNANYQIFMSEYRNGNWTNPSSITDNISPNGTNAYNPQVAMSDNGDAIITWYQVGGAFNQIYMSEYRNGNWNHPTSLADYISFTTQPSNANEVAMDADGNAIVVWQQLNGVHNQIFKREFRNGAWTLPTGLNDNISPDGQNATLPQVVMNDNGTAVITWQQSDGVSSQIFKSEYRSSAWIHPLNLSDNISPNGQQAINSSVSLDDAGNTIIVWQQYDGSIFTQIYKSEYRNGVWVHPTSLFDHISPSSSTATNPRVNLDNQGQAVIVWEQRNGPIAPNTYYEIFKSEYRSGTWTHPSSLSDNISQDGTNANAPEVALSDAGEALILWIQSDGLNQQIFMSEYK